MIDIRKQPALIECINAVLTAGNKAEIQREGRNIVVISVEERRRPVGRFETSKIKV